MRIVDFILEDIEKKIARRLSIHYALQGKRRVDILKQTYEKALTRYEDLEHFFIYITEENIKNKNDFLCSIIEKDFSNYVGWRELARYLMGDSRQRFIFVEEFDGLITRIDKDYSLSESIIKMDNVYVTITSSSNPETIAPLVKTNSPYWLHDYFRVVNLDK